MFSVDSAAPIDDEDCRAGVAVGRAAVAADRRPRRCRAAVRRAPRSRSPDRTDAGRGRRRLRRVPGRRSAGTRRTDEPNRTPSSRHRRAGDFDAKSPTSRRRRPVPRRSRRTDRSTGPAGRNGISRLGVGHGGDDGIDRRRRSDQRRRSPLCRRARSGRIAHAAGSGGRSPCRGAADLRAAAARPYSIDVDTRLTASHRAFARVAVSRLRGSTCPAWSPTFRRAGTSIAPDRPRSPWRRPLADPLVADRRQVSEHRSGRGRAGDDRSGRRIHRDVRRRRDHGAAKAGRLGSRRLPKRSGDG